MNERELRNLVADVKAGRLSRRKFVQGMIALGLTAPMAGMMLSHNGVAWAAEEAFTYKPTKAGGGGTLKTLFWQGATLLNPHFAVGTKDQEGSRIFYEPLAAWDANGNLVPVLAASIPSKENGALAADGRRGPGRGPRRRHHGQAWFALSFISRNSRRRRRGSRP